jgi:hypothetical protein
MQSYVHGVILDGKSVIFWPAKGLSWVEPYFAFNQKRDVEYSAIDKHCQVTTDKCYQVVGDKYKNLYITYIIRRAHLWKMAQWPICSSQKEERIDFSSNFRD